MKAIETTGHIEKPYLLKLDNPVEIQNKHKVKVIILYSDNGDIEEKLWLSALSTNPAFGFLNDEKENIYSINDGKPLKK